MRPRPRNGVKKECTQKCSSVFIIMNCLNDVLRCIRQVRTSDCTVSNSHFTVTVMHIAVSYKCALTRSWPVHRSRISSENTNSNGRLQPYCVCVCVCMFTWVNEMRLWKYLNTTARSDRTKFFPTKANSPKPSNDINSYPLCASSTAHHNTIPHHVAPYHQAVMWNSHSAI